MQDLFEMDTALVLGLVIGLIAAVIVVKLGVSDNVNVFWKTLTFIAIVIAGIVSAKIQAKM